MDYLFLSVLLLAGLIYLSHYPLLVLPILSALLFVYVKRASIVAKWDKLKGASPHVQSVHEGHEGLPRLESWEEEILEADARIRSAAVTQEEARLIEELRRNDSSSEDAFPTPADNGEEEEEDSHRSRDSEDLEPLQDEGLGNLLRGRRRIPPAVPPKPERSISQEEFDERNRSRLPPYLLVKDEDWRVQRLHRLNITNQVNAIAGHFANIENAPPVQPTRRQHPVADFNY